MPATPEVQTPSPIRSLVPGSRQRPDPLPLVPSPRLTRLAERLAGLTDQQRRAELAGFWEEVAHEGTPLIEPVEDPDQRIATFVVRTPLDDSREVLLQANRLTDPANPAATLLRRLPGTDISALSLRMPAGWRATYQFTWHEPGSVPTDRAFTPADLRLHRSTGRVDPLARRQFPARKQMAASSVVELPAAPPQPWREPRDGVPRGTLESALLDDAGGVRRRVTCYLPPATAGPPQRLLVLLDGEVWRDQLPFAPSLDNLIADGAIPSTAALLVDAGDEEYRWRDFAASARFLSFLTERALPWADEVSGWDRRTTRRTAQQTVLAGQSLGGVFAIWAGLVAPDVAGAAIAQSPSLWWRGPGTGPVQPGQQAGRPEWLTDFARLCRPRPEGPRILLEVGRQEWLLVGPARRFKEAALGCGLDLTYAEFDGGHDHACWWGGLADAIRDLLGPPAPEPPGSPLPPVRRKDIP